MSRFSVMVVTPPSRAKDWQNHVEEVLAPFHEFECTGLDDKYVKDIDVTEDYHKRYAEETELMVRGEFDGHVREISAFDDLCYRDPTPAELQDIGPFGGSGRTASGVQFFSKDWGDGRGYRAKVRFVPPGYTEVWLPTKELQTFLDYCVEDGKPFLREGEPKTTDHKFGFTLVSKDGHVLKVIDRTNPDRKWDWYQIGGRWSGMLQVRKDASKNLVAKGEPGVMGSKYGDGVDSCLFEDLDLAGMHKTAMEHRAETWDKAKARFDERRDGFSMPFEDAIAAYGTLVKSLIPQASSQSPLWKLLEEASPELQRMCSGLTWDGIDCRQESHQSRSRYIESVKAFGTFAVILDGKWYERGEMGWWGVVTGEKGDDVWDAEFQKLIAGLDPLSRITIVDCHI